MAFWNKNKKTEKTVKKNKETDNNSDIINGIVEGGVSAENAIIVYILRQALENNIELCYSSSTQTTFLSFRNEKLKEFLKEWFTILKLYQNNQLSKNMYEIFITAQLKENHSDKLMIKEDEKNDVEKSKNEFDEFLDILK